MRVSTAGQQLCIRLCPRGPGHQRTAGQRCHMLGQLWQRACRARSALTAHQMCAPQHTAHSTSHQLPQPQRSPAPRPATAPQLLHKLVQQHWPGAVGVVVAQVLVHRAGEGPHLGGGGDRGGQQQVVAGRGRWLQVEGRRWQWLVFFYGRRWQGKATGGTCRCACWHGSMCRHGEDCHGVGWGDGGGVGQQVVRLTWRQVSSVTTLPCWLRPTCSQNLSSRRKRPRSTSCHPATATSDCSSSGERVMA
jgi:hypothetical protein